MTHNESIWRRAGSELAGSMRDGARAARQQPFIDGYSEAAHIYVDLLQSKIDGLHGRMKESGSLSEKEQFLLSHPVDLKAESERALRDYWDDPNNNQPK